MLIVYLCDFDALGATVIQLSHYLNAAFRVLISCLNDSLYHLDERSLTHHVVIFWSPERVPDRNEAKYDPQNIPPRV